MKWTALPVILLIIVALFVFSLVGTVLSVIGTLVVTLLGAAFAIIGILLKLLFTPIVGLLFLGALIWFLVYRRRESRTEIKS